MAIVKRSFLSNLIGRNTYDELKGYARKIIAIGTCVLVVLFGLSLICHYSFVSSTLSMVTGTSLLFIVYIAALIVLLDYEVDVEEYSLFEEKNEGCSRNYIERKEIEKTREYKRTIVWGIVLILLGVLAVYFSNRYRKHYAFECETYLVDHQAGIYHFDLDNGCELIEAGNWERLHGYQINKSYKLCNWCENWAEDAESRGEGEKLSYK